VGLSDVQAVRRADGRPQEGSNEAAGVGSEDRGARLLLPPSCLLPPSHAVPRLSMA
jgi:hypothetical protein